MVKSVKSPSPVIIAFALNHKLTPYALFSLEKLIPGNVPYFPLVNLKLSVSNIGSADNSGKSLDPKKPLRVFEPSAWIY